MSLTLETVKNFLVKYKTIIFVSIMGLIVLLIVMILSSYYIISPYKKFVINPTDNSKADIGLVLGAGVAENGKPYKELQARLDRAADALNQGVVDKLIVSGDNRFQNYDEPTAMFNYLVDKRSIPEDKLIRDYAGRSTYESCERASKVFQIKKVVIFSAGSHLPRAIYLCRHFGIESYGISSDIEANNSTRREILARVKAVYNANLVGERTILGEPIPFN